jgi:hypothetical protein
MPTKPLFDMSKAQPIQGAGAPLFDMSKAQPIGQDGALQPSQPDQGGPTARFLTRATGLPIHDIAEHPSAYLNPFSHEYWDKAKEESAQAGPPTVPKNPAELIPGHQTYEDIKSGNYAGAAGDIAGTAAAVAPLLFGGREMGPGEMPGAGPKSVITAPVRAGARVAEAALNKTVKPVARLFTPADEAIEPLKVPGRDLGLPKRGSIAKSMGPGAPFPETPDPALLQSHPLSTGPQPAPPRPSDALGNIPVARGSIAKSMGPGAPFPETPDPALLQSHPLSTGPQPAPPRPSDALGNIPVARGSIAKSMEPQTSAKPITRGSLSQMMGDQLEKGLGASPPLKPNVPLRGQISTTMKEAAPQIPEGHTAVDSTAIRSYKYDPQTQEFEAWPTSGDTAYRYGEVSPDAAKAFQDAASKGKAFQQIKNSGTLVAKRVNGKWVSVKPARGAISEQMSK